MTAWLFALAAALYLGFQWTIRLVVYPQFAAVPPTAFVAYERAHQRLVSVAVGPLFVLLGATSIAFFLVPPAGVSRWWGVLGGAGVAAILGVTAAAAVPLHRALSAGFDPAVHRRLLRVDTVRLLAAAATLACAIGGVVAGR